MFAKAQQDPDSRWTGISGGSAVGKNTDFLTAARRIRPRFFF
jgi:hypothetical protein